MLKKTRSLAAAAVLAPLAVQGGPLEDYVKKEDSSFGHRVSEEVTVMGVRVLKVRLTSQTWRGKEWQHWLTIFVPPLVGEHRKGILLIEGGRNGDRAPDHNQEAAATIGMSAMMLKAPIALLLQVPNQPLYGDLKEDDLISYTFKHYLEDGDADWPLLLPMVKSATAAMTAVQEMAGAGKLGGPAGKKPGVDKFIVGGASKRGWTTWLTSAVDPRVCALAPSVIDVLNMPEQMKHQRRSYGEFSKKLRPYTERGILKQLETEEGRELVKIVDPFTYRGRIKQPKLLLLGSNDPYWTADSAQLYYGQLVGPKAIYYVPNKGHGLGVEVLPTLNNFLASVLEEKPFPQLSHEVADGSLKVSWKGEAQATVWTATSAGRDFRKAKWIPKRLPGGEQAAVKLEKPASGWRAVFVTATFPGVREGDLPFGLSTPIQVVPDVYPH